MHPHPTQPHCMRFRSIIIFRYYGISRLLQTTGMVIAAKVLVHWDHKYGSYICWPVIYIHKFCKIRVPLKTTCTSLKWETICKNYLIIIPGISSWEFLNCPFNCLQLVANGNKVWLHTCCIISLECHHPIRNVGIPIFKLSYRGESYKQIDKTKEKLLMYFMVYEIIHIIISYTSGYAMAQNLIIFSRYVGSIIVFFYFRNCMLCVEHMQRHYENHFITAELCVAFKHNFVGEWKQY